jgi:hypothetical protein
MSYVPPHLRNTQLPVPKKETVLDMDDFPALGGSSNSKHSSNLKNGSFAEQAKRWEEKRLNDEYMKRVEEEMEQKRRERQEKRDLEDHVLRSQFVSFSKRQEQQPVYYSKRPEFIEPTAVNEWQEPGQLKRTKQIERDNRKERERLSKLNNENHSSSDDDNLSEDELEYAAPEDRWT